MSWLYKSPMALLATLLLCNGAAAQQKSAEPSASDEYEVEDVEEIQVPMHDGVKLAGNMFMPKAKRPGERFPVLLHVTPYCETIYEQKFTRGGGEEPPRFPIYFARHGYVKVYVETRGTCRSEGAPPTREYSDIESKDSAEAIAWLARQPWSNGKVGMYGLSWSGFIAARVAMLKPPALKAISIAAGTEDVYSESDWLWNGIYQVNAYQNWIDLFVAMPPPPDFPLTERMFKEKFDHEPWNVVALRHQMYDSYWWPEKRADVNPNIIQVPTMMVGGFADVYRDSIPRMLEHLKAPTTAVIGYWEHNTTGPGPFIAYREKMLRWWDHWLKGIDNGVLKDPKLVVYLGSHQPEPWFNGFNPQEVEGEWRAEDWPPQGLVKRTMYLQPDHGLRDAAPTAPDHHVLQYIASTGIQNSFDTDPAQHGYDDQRNMDAYSLVYDTEPLKEELAILGRAKATLHGSATARLAHWFVRLEDVAPDGKVALVTDGALNGTYRNNPAKPEYLKPGEVYTFPVELHIAGWIFKPGHRVRVGISNAMWPINWPSPYQMTTTLELGASNIVLPIVPAHSDRPLPSFARPTPMKWRPYDGRGASKVTYDPQTRTTTVYSASVWDRDPKNPILEYSAFNGNEEITYTVSDLHPEAASVHTEHSIIYPIPGRMLVFEQHAQIRSDENNFYYTARRWVTENGKVVHEKNFNETIPRLYR